MQAGCLQAVRGDGLHSGKDGTEEGHEEASDGGVVVSVGCEADADDDGYERAVGLSGIRTVKHGAVDCDDKYRSGGSQDLVERNRDQGARAWIRGTYVNR